MTSLDYLRGEKEIKIRINSDRRLLSTKINELNEQTTLDTINKLTFETLKQYTREFAKRLNSNLTAQELLDEC